MKYYTIGEILRQKLLISPISRKAYKDKASISRIVQRLPHKKIQTPYGAGYGVTLSTIKKYNTKVRGTMHA